ncbi:MAG: hypothetical protein P8X57_12765, partial [Cyclobacteriaceae bacterium]
MNSKAISPLWLILIFVVAKVLMHIPASIWEGYGIFRDELYYLACANQLDTGYVDHPPLSIWMLAAWTQVFG